MFIDSCSIKTVTKFISDEANVLLLEYFSKHDGIAITDEENNKPACRTKELENLLLVARQNI